MDECRRIATFARGLHSHRIETTTSCRTPKHQKEMEYYISSDNGKQGPYTLEELRHRNITAETLVMESGSGQWTPAWQLRELRPLFEKPEPVAPAPVTEQATPSVPPSQPIIEPMSQASAAETVPPVTPPEKSTSSRGCTGCLLSLLILAIIGAAFVFTCPTEEQHKMVLSGVIKDAVSDMTDEALPGNNNVWLRGIQKVGGIVLSGLVDDVIDEFIVVDNYFVCSVGKVHFSGKSHLVSVGVPGHVFTMNKEDVKEATEKYVREAKSKLGNSVQQQINEAIVDPIKDKLKESLLDPLQDLLRGFTIPPDDEEEPEE